MDDSALALAKLINSDGFQRKLNDLIKAKADAEEAQKSAEKAKADAEATVAAMTELNNRQKADLDAARVLHDKASDEAALRLNLVKTVKAEQDKRQVELDIRENDLVVREKQVEAAHNHFTGAMRQLGLTAP